MKMKKFLIFLFLAVSCVFGCVGCGGDFPTVKPPAASEEAVPSDFFIPRTPEEIRPLPEPGPDDEVGELSADLGGKKNRFGGGGTDDDFNYRLSVFLRDKVERHFIHFYTVGEGGESYYGTWEWIPGSVKRLKVGAYLMYAETYSKFYGGNFTSGTRQLLEIFPGPNAPLIIFLKRQNSVIVPVRVVNPVGVYTDAGAEVLAVRGDGFSQSSGWAVSSSGGLVFSIYFHPPYLGGEFEISALDSEGKEQFMRCIFDRERIFSENPVKVEAEKISTGELPVEWIYSEDDIRVSCSHEDPENSEGIVVAGRKGIPLAKFNFVALKEAIVNEIRLLLPVGAINEVPVLNIYDGDTLLGVCCVDSFGRAVFANLNWQIPSRSSRILSVKGDLNSLECGADSGTTFFVSVVGFGGGVTSGKEKTVFKSYPVISQSSTSLDLIPGLNSVIKFKIRAEGNKIEWKKISFYFDVVGANADMAGIKFRSVFTGSDIACAVSSEGPSFFSLILDAPEIIMPGPGFEKEYELLLLFDKPGKCQQALACRVETELMGGNFGSLSSGNSFVWSDCSAPDGHSENSPDWVNGVLVPGLIFRPSGKG